MLVIPDKMSQEKILHLRALGAEMCITRSDVGKGHPEYYQDMAERIAREIQRLLRQSIRQSRQPAGARDDDRARDLAADGAAARRGRRRRRLGRHARPASAASSRASRPQVEMVLADPEGSTPGAAHRRPAGRSRLLADRRASARISCRPTASFSRVRRAYAITRSRELRAPRASCLRREGILGGSSTGTLLAAALRYCREQTEPKRVVTLVCDSGNKYLSKMYNDFWMFDQGLLERADAGRSDRPHRAPPCRGQRRHRESPEDTLDAAYRRMRLYDVSQLPVMQDERIVGIVDEEDILLEVVERPRALQRAGTPRHGEPPGDDARGCTAVAADGDLQAWHGGDRDGRQRVPGPHHPHRPAQLVTPEATCAAASSCSRMATRYPMDAQ